MKTGLVITGGGLHGAFACGVLKQWADAGVEFPHIVGTGYGALMGAYYRAGQGDAIGAIYNNFMRKYGDELEFFGLFKGGERAIDGVQLFKCAEEVDMAAYNQSSTGLSIATTRADNGDGVFWPIDRITEWKELRPYLLSEVCLPGEAEPVGLVERHYFEGRIAEPLPITAALEQGCDRLVVVHTKRSNDMMKRRMLTPLQMVALKQYPKLRNVYLLSHLHYNDELRLLHRLEHEGKALVISPTVQSCHRRRYGVSMSAVSEYYTNGRRVGIEALEAVQTFLKENH